MNITVEPIDEHSPFLHDVKNLWRKNSKTLGFFPEGAFDDHAAKQWILVARNDKSGFLGYLLYRVVRGKGFWPVAAITHLSVVEEYRSSGVARILVDELRRITKDTFLKIELKCRRDYEADKFWPKAGFRYVGETQGRSGYTLSKWEMTFRQLPLMELLSHDTVSKKFQAVIDANILYRWQDSVPDDRQGKTLSEEAKALQADWLSEDIAFFITEETSNEIRKNDDPALRKRRLSYVAEFERLSADLDRVRELESRIEAVFSTVAKDKMGSDVRQLSQAIAGGAHFFITQDTGLLKKKDSIHNEFEIKVLSPGELVARIDEVIREVEYRPNRLGGAQTLEKSRVRSEQVPTLYPAFRRLNGEEKKNAFETDLRRFVAQPSRYEVEICTREDSGHLALTVYDRNETSTLSIPVIRVSKSNLSGTVFRYLLRNAILVAAREKRPFIRVSNTPDQSGLDIALEEMGFTPIGTEWIKCGLQVADTSRDLLVRLDELRRSFNEFAPLLSSLFEALTSADETQDLLALIDVERRLWPAKILDADVPTYVVPILPAWAQNLFDEEIAGQTLWGGREDLMLGNENVYYRNRRPNGRIISPARILWYVTKDSHPGSMQIRACSYLDEVVIGRAKDLFRRFERLGIYEWQDVLRTAGKAENHIMALRFSNTENLPQPIDLTTYKQILLQEENKQPVLQSPQRISPKTFARLYQMAIGIPGGD